MLIMIDKTAADAAMRRIRVGDRVSAHFNEKQVTYLVLSKPTEGYALICQSPTNKVSMGIACTDIYKEELNRMRISDPSIDPAAEKPRGRGRPPKPKNEVQSTAPGNGFLPPGSDYVPNGAPIVKPAPTIEGKAMEVQGGQNAYSEVPIEKAEGNDNWLVDSIDTAVKNFRDELMIIFEAIDNDANEDRAPAPVIKTCGHCMHVELDGSPSCLKYNGSPPLSVVLNAQKNCSGFEEIPS
jgi:hypothetical protein